MLMKFGMMTAALLVVFAWPALAERPMGTDDPYVSPRGFLTIEAGNHLNKVREDPFQGRYFNLFDVNLIYGLTKRTEISVHNIAGVAVYEEGAPDKTRWGAEEMTLAIKNAGPLFFNWLRFGVEGAFFLPFESDPFLGGDQQGGEINTMFEIDLGPVFYRGALGYTAPIEEIDEGDLMAGMALRTDLHEGHFGFIELFSEVSPEDVGSDMPLIFAAGGGYEAESIGIIDAAAVLGFNNEEPDWGFRTGITSEIQLFRRD